MADSLMRQSREYFMRQHHVTAPLHEIRNFFRRNFNKILLTTIAVLAIPVILIFVHTPKYEAYAVVQVDVQSPDIALDHPDVKSIIPIVVRSHVDTIKTRVLSKVVDKLNLIDDEEFNVWLKKPSFFKHFLSIALDKLGEVGEYINDYLVKNRLVHPSISDSTDSNEGGSNEGGITHNKDAIRSSVLENVRELLAVGNDGRSLNIYISFTSENPSKAAIIVNTIANEFVSNQLAWEREHRDTALQWLSLSLAEMKESVKQSKEAVQRFREEHGLISSQPESLTLAAEQLKEYSTRLVGAQVELSGAQSRLDQALNRQSAHGSATEILNSGLIQSLRVRESEARQREAEQANTLGARHPQLLKVRAELTDIRSKIAEEEQKIIDGIRNELTIAQTKEDAIQKKMNEVRDQMAFAMKLGLKLQELEREAEANRTTYEALLARYKQEEGYRLISHVSVKIVSPANMPAWPTTPSRVKLFWLASIFSILVATVLIAVVEKLNRGFHLAQDVERSTGYRSLGLLPILARSTRKNLVRSEPSAANSSDKYEPYFCEGLRALNSLLRIDDTHKGPITMMVTSSVPREGKTTLCLFYAKLLAKSGYRVLLIDADLRRRNLSKLLGHDQGGDLSDFLDGRRALQEVVQHDSESGLDYIVSVKKVDDPQGMLSYRKLQRLRQALMVRQAPMDYMVVIIDTPPILPISDAGSVARFTDICLFIVQWSSTPKEVALNGLRRLGSFTNNISGVILTKVDLRKHARYDNDDAGYVYSRYKNYYLKQN